MKAEYTYTQHAPPPLPQGEGKSSKYENKVRALSIKILTIIQVF